MDTWLILYFLLKRKGKAVKPKRIERLSLLDTLYIFANELNVYQPFTLEDKITLGGTGALSSIMFDLGDVLDLSDNVVNALLKLTLEDKITLSGNNVNALLKLLLEDSLNISDNLRNVYNPMNFEDTLSIMGNCVKAFESSLEHGLEDEFTLYSGCVKAFENVLSINVEDSLNISDSLKDMRLRLTLEDSLNVSDSLKPAMTKISLEDSINVSDSLKSAVKSLALEDSLNIGDNVALSVDKRDLEDAVSIRDRLAVPCLDNDIDLIRSMFRLHVHDTDTWIRGDEEEWTLLKKCNGYYWLGFEDMKGQPNPDFDYEDVYITIEEQGDDYVCKIYHGEHDYTIDVYYGDVKLATLGSHGGSKRKPCEIRNDDLVTTVKINKYTLSLYSTW